MEQHPSFVALDRLHLGLGLEADQRHAQTCDRCGAYLGRLAQPLSVPAALEDRLAPRPRWRRWPWLAGGLATAAAVLALLVPAEPEVRTKGAPASSLFVKRGDAVTRWDGATSVVAGDGLQLEVQPEGFGWLVVLDGAELLWQGAVTTPRHTLPVSWRVEPGTEVVELRLVFSQAPLSPAEALGAWTGGERSAQRWATTLRLVVAPAR